MSLHATSISIRTALGVQTTFLDILRATLTQDVSLVTVANMRSIRFQRPVIITLHAKLRMAERTISDTLLLEVIETGDTRYADTTHLWIYKYIPDRQDNLLCVVLVLEDVVVVKTVMHHFEVL